MESSLHGQISSNRSTVLLLLLVLFIISSLGLPHGVEASSPHTEIFKNKEPHHIQVCCGWGNKLVNGTLTYRTIGGDITTQQGVREAIHEWNAKMGGNIRIIEVAAGNVIPDIEINFNPNSQKLSDSSNNTLITSGYVGNNAVTAGQSVNSFDKDGFITNVKITISRSAFGYTFDLNKIKQLTEHEVGHALGLQHTNFNGDLMSPIVSYKADSISKCDINAVLEANYWKTIELGIRPHSPYVKYVAC
jgi:Matrixin